MSDEIFGFAGPIFGSKVVVSQNLIPIGLQGTLKDFLACWGTIVKPLKIRKSNLETFGLCWFFWPLWPWGSNSFDRLNSYAKTVHISQKNYEIVWNQGVVFGVAFEIFFGLFKFFLRSMILKKSSGVLKSCMWVVFHPKHKPTQIFHSCS